MTEKHDSLINEREKEIAESRRDFLKKAGRFAAYTPPAMMLLMKPSHASIMRSGGGIPPAQDTGNLKQYYNFNLPRPASSSTPATAPDPKSWLDYRKSWWTNFWGRFFG